MDGEVPAIANLDHSLKELRKTLRIPKENFERTKKKLEEN